MMSLSGYDLADLFVWNQDAMLAESSAQISPFDMRIARVVRELQDELRGLVPSAVIASRLMMARRTARYYLKRAENAGLLHRPLGARSGYSAIQGVICSLAVRDSIERQAQELSELDVQLLRLLAGSEMAMAGLALAHDVGVSRRTAQRHLKKMETANLVWRPDGERSGYRLRSLRTMMICAYAEATHLQSKIQPFHRRVLHEIRWRERFCDAVSSRLLGQYLEVPERSMRYYLRQMESMNLVHRPMGSKAGYRLTGVGLALNDLEGNGDGTLN